MRLPIFQHPCLTVLVGGGEPFAAGDAKAFGDPLAALDWLKRQAGIGRDLAPAVVVVEQGLAGMTGVDFCAALDGQPCKKILLTGAGGERAAIDAFNRGLIDRAIRRDDDDGLARAIAALRLEYFLEVSDTIIAPAALGEYSFLADAAVARLVREVSAQHGIVEHYLHAAPAGLMLIDAAGAARLMVIESADSMQAHHEVARDSGAPQSLLDALDARCIVPWFRNGDGMYDESVGERWYRCCEPARMCPGAQPYYWALFEAAKTWV